MSPVNQAVNTNGRQNPETFTDVLSESVSLALLPVFDLYIAKEEKYPEIKIHMVPGRTLKKKD